MKVEPVAADALSVTSVPSLKSSKHTLPQLIPGGLLVTVPEPNPSRATVKVCCGTTSNVAVTLRSPPIDTTHGPTPVHAPLQPANSEPAGATGVSVTCVPSL